MVREITTTFADEVVARSGQNIRVCYHCLKCTVGCPLSAHMDRKPNGVIRMIQYGAREELLSSHAVWLCLSCMTCAVRCPNDIDMGVVFDTLREMSREAGLAYKAERKVVVLHEEFVRNVRIWGRLHEVSFFLPYMLRTLDFFSNIVSGVNLVLRWKLPMIPTRLKHMDEIRTLYREGYRTKGELGTRTGRDPVPVATAQQ